MAGNNTNRRVTITAHTKGVTEATKKVKGLGKATTETARKQNEIKRAQEGVHKESLSTAKAFSKQQQGLGGLVRAYATVAANIFALTAAYGILRRAADFQSMIASANNLEARLGTSVNNIAKDIQRATGHALDFTKALESTNRALSAGFKASQAKELADIVARASQTFGGSVEANMNKAINAVLRGRTETLATMGIVIDLNRAYTDYATTLGKTAKDLSKYEQQQAVINALLREGKTNLEGIDLDANPFQQLANTLFDTAQDLLKLVIDITQPFIKLINLSKEFARLLIATLGALFLKKLTPDIQGYEAAAASSLNKITVAMQRQKFVSIRLANSEFKKKKELLEAAKEAKRQELIEWIKAEEQKVVAGQKVNKTMQALFNEVRINGTNAFRELNAETRRALGSMSTSATKSLKNAGDPTIMSQMKGMEAQKTKSLRDAGDVILSGNIRRVNRELAQVTVSVNSLGLAYKKLSNEVGLASAHLSRSWTKQRLSTMGLIQQQGLLTGSLRAYQLALVGARRDTDLYVRAGGRLAGTFQVIATSARLASTSVGLLQAGLNKLFPIISTLTMIFFAWNFIKDFFGWGKVPEEINRVKEAFDRLDETIGKTSKRVGDFNTLSKRAAEQGLAGIGARATFMGNAFAELLDPLEEVRSNMQALTYTDDGVAIEDAIRSLTAEIAESKRGLEEYAGAWGWLRKQVKEFNDYASQARTARLPGMRPEEDPEEPKNILKDREKELKRLQEQVKTVADELAGYASRAVGTIISNATMLDQINPELTKTYVETQISSIVAELKARGVNVTAGFEGAMRQAIEKSDPKIMSRFVTRSLATLDTNSSRITGAYLQQLRAFLDAFGSVIDVGRSTEEQFLQSAAAVQGTLEVLGNLAEVRSKGKDYFLDKAEVTEQAKIVRDLRNSITDAISGGIFSEDILADILGNVDLSSIIDTSKITATGTEGLSQLKQALERTLSVYQRFAENKALAPLFKTIRDTERTINQTGLQRTTNLDEIEKRTRRISQLQKEQLEAELETNLITQNRIAEDIRISGIYSDRARILNVELKTLKAQENLLRTQAELILPDLDGILERLKIEREITNARIASTNNIIGAETRLRNLLGDTNSIYAAQVEIFKKRAVVIRQQQAAFESEVQSIQLKIEAGTANTEDLKKLIALEGQLISQMVEVKALARETARTTIRLSANDGNMEAKQQSFLLQLVEAGEELARNMEDSGKRAAKGISDAITKSFDTAIDMLLEGTGDFIEAFKGILRETLGDFLKQNIQQATTALFATLAKEKLLSMGGEAAETVQDMSIAATGANTSALQALSIQVGNLITVLGAPSIDVTKPMSLAKTGENQTSGILNTIAGNTAMTTSATEDVASTVVSEGFQQAVHATELAALQAISLGVGQLVMGQVQTNFLLQTMGGSEAVGGVIGGLGAAFSMGGAVPAADGAIFDGGLKRYATGGITNGPELALIGEGRNREAVIPMPNNKEVPVQLLGSGGNDINVTNVYDFRNADPAAETKLRAHSEKIKRDTFNNVFNEINKGGSYAKMVGRRK